MSAAKSRIQLRELLTGDYVYTRVAPIFDTLSAGMAQSMGWKVGKFSSSTLKMVNFGLPDEVDDLVNLTDFAEVIRRVSRVAPDVSLTVDMDDAGGNPLLVFRTIRELEAAGISSIEIEDRAYPHRLMRAEQEAEGQAEGCVFHPVDEQVANLKTALDAREDPNTVIIARTAAFADRQLPGGALPVGQSARGGKNDPDPTELSPALPLDEALERIRAYAESGVDGIYLPGEPAHIRADIEAIHSVTDLPLLVLRMPRDVYKDTDFLRRNNVRLHYLGQPVLQMATDAIYNSLKSLQEGGSGTDAPELDMAYWPGGLQMSNRLSRWREFAKIDHKYDIAQ